MLLFSLTRSMDCDTGIDGRAKKLRRRYNLLEMATR